MSVKNKDQFYIIFIEIDQFYVYFNVAEKWLKIITDSFNNNYPFWFCGEIVKPTLVKTIAIFREYKPYEKLIMPNGKSPKGQHIDYIYKNFRKGLVDYVYECTLEFINFLEHEKQTVPVFMPELPAQKLIKNKIFIVHGRDKTPALELKDYLKELKLNAVIFDDVKKNKTSPTIIEILEEISRYAGYAFITATPDDLGAYFQDIQKCKEDLFMNPETTNVKNAHTILSKFKSRARQNVVFEHGLFIGALGRDRVCCLLQVDTQDTQTDIDGIVYVPFKESVKETFQDILEKLKEPKIGLIKS